MIVPVAVPRRAGSRRRGTRRPPAGRTRDARAAGRPWAAAPAAGGARHDRRAARGRGRRDGASSGIGRATAVELAGKEAAVVAMALPAAAIRPSIARRRWSRTAGSGAGSAATASRIRAGRRCRRCSRRPAWRRWPAGWWTGAVEAGRRAACARVPLW